MHDGGAARCPSTGLRMGGDPAIVGATLAERYAVVRLLGDGGMGAVYKAVDQKLSRFVALKVLHKHVAANPLLVERLAREARSAAAVGHPNIVDVIDFSEDRTGPLMVMEYLKGRSLASLLEREGPLPVERACSILAHALAGLSAAHQRGVLHRDLKPANLMLVSRLGDHDFVKVCDFGFAAFLEPSRDEATEHTPQHMFIGTPSYAAPERWVGDEKRDARTDLYSAGVILYEMLAGRRPFVANDVSELVRKVRGETPAPIRSTRGDVPARLEQVVMRALSKSVDERWQTAAELAEALVPFGGRRIEREPDEPSEAFEVDLLEIRAREVKHQQESEALLLSVSDALPDYGEEQQVTLEVDPRGRGLAAPVVLAVLRFLSVRFGDARLRAVLEGLPVGAREVFQRGISPTAWVPYDAVQRLMELIDVKLGSNDLRFIVECGRAIAEGVFEQRAELEPQALTPAGYFAALPAVGNQLVRGIEYVVQRAGRGHGRLELIEATQEPSVTGCVATLGFLERSLMRSGAHDVEVNLISCRALGDERCLFDATWL